jgi:hypothetical protein
VRSTTPLPAKPPALLKVPTPFPFPETFEVMVTLEIVAPEVTPANTDCRELGTAVGVIAWAKTALLFIAMPADKIAKKTIACAHSPVLDKLPFFPGECTPGSKADSELPCHEAEKSAHRCSTKDFIEVLSVTGT